MWTTTHLWTRPASLFSDFDNSTESSTYIKWHIFVSCNIGAYSSDNFSSISLMNVLDNNGLNTFPWWTTWVIIIGSFKTFLHLKSWLYFKRIKVAYRNSILNLGLIRREAKKTMVVIYKVMCTRHVNILWELKLSSVSTMNHLVDFGVGALAGCIIFIT